MGSPALLGVLCEPTLRLGIAVDTDVPAAFEDDLEVVPIDRLVRPPAIDDAPLLAHQRHLFTIHDVRRPTRRRLDQRRPRGIEATR